MLYTFYFSKIHGTELLWVFFSDIYPTSNCNSLCEWKLHKHDPEAVWWANTGYTEVCENHSGGGILQPEES